MCNPGVQLALLVEGKMTVSVIMPPLAMHQWHDGVRRLY